ncbi:2-oxoacid:acceptor oxidoreductase subunit alpha [Carboxylicivirga sp. A043]|uniref:2-oxoacid:acceptor oxidoreductase subunit alpha n=1 Tax=Carboxylicivirga litoralis TaxID=2816963 RepID=UPI0021CB2964|nr:2-oxoacid:acceptor oxidoreductase subunit alpha [Carboxylicivirga sp. A043]MCU4154912.1 2-oxoacid:acceptor oxidoreductase subunit alpha [Carboxylicivirga sp. A043]
MGKRSKVIERDEVVVRFSGDSGDGMQLTGTLFSYTSAIFGNDISTFPDYPSEIRAPQGTISGVSGFQVHFGHTEVYTPGDYCDVLVAMNPAALKANAKWMKPGGTVVLDVDSCDEKNLRKAGYETNDPITESKLGDYNIVKAPITTLTKESLKDMGLDNKSILRSKNMYALGLVYWLFDRPLDHTKDYIKKKFAKKPLVVDANIKVLEDGYNYGNIIQALTPSYHIHPADIKKGKYRNLSGNTAVAWGFLAAAEKSGLELFLGSYPITPATEILQELSARKDLGVKVFQAEDEIAGICTSIGASFAGNLAVTTTSGPGLALKGEAIGLAVIAELPLVIVNVQRGGPSTGLPTKTEQSDLMQALYGRNGESPAVIIAASSPTNCFDYAFYAAKIAVEHMTPVILLTDGFLANGTQPWLLPNLDEWPTINVPKADVNDKDWHPYKRDAQKLARYWAAPGTPGLEHRIGGLEKDEHSGAVSHDALNHQRMVEIREEKVQRIANDVPELELLGDEDADTLVVGWGGTFGHLFTAVDELQSEGHKLALAHFNYIKPLPRNTYEVLKRYKKIVVCELNLGQFADYLTMNFPDIQTLRYNKVQGQPFTVVELKEHFKTLLEE